jgi:pyridoxamine 5'-phosphate oxidase
MTKFINPSQDKPYLIFREQYETAKIANQKNIEAILISSFNSKKKEVDSRFVNLKFVNNEEFIFFSNYESPKAEDFRTHSQISACIFWSSINIQIRFKAIIKKTSAEFNNNYFRTRHPGKNALAISSNQSQIIDSYESVEKKYNDIKDYADLESCPKSWGGFSFIPYEFEFWHGHEKRLNKRIKFIKSELKWENYILEP